MEYEEEVNKIRKVVEEAIKLIKAGHAGANLDEARRLLSEAGVALKAEKFNESIALAQKAQLAAKPTTDHLLSKANKLAASAEKSFGSINYEEAIDLWKKALDEYVRAEDLARDRDENEIVERMAEIERMINKNIFKAEVTIDNREMLRLVDAGNSSLEGANRLFEDKKFDGSKKEYEAARKTFKSALGLAEKRKFDADQEKIRGALGSIETSIDAVLLSKGDAMLKKGEENFKGKKFTEAERTFATAIEYLEGLKIQRKEREEMLDVGREELIRAKLEQGREKMRAADSFFKDKKYYEAKEGYKDSREYLEGVLEEASDHKFSKLVEELNNMIQTCSQKIPATMAPYLKVGGVEQEILTIDGVAKGAAEFKGEVYEPTGTPTTRFTTLRTVWDPNKKDFVWGAEKPNEYGELPRIKRWIEDKNPNIYWFLLKIVNLADYPVTEWNATLYTEQALTITEAHLDEKQVRIVKSDFDTNRNRNVYVVAIPSELGVSIPANGGRRSMYFKMDIRCEDALKMEFGVSGVVKLGKSPQIEMPIREKRFTYACKYGDFRNMYYGSIDALASLMVANLQNSYSREIVQNFTNSFRLIREFEKYCNNRYVESKVLIEKLEVIHSSLKTAEPITKEEILPLVEENLNIFRVMSSVEAQKEGGIRMCEKLIELLHIATSKLQR